MGTSRAKRHVHKYHKINAAYVKLWACSLPDCNHHTPKYLEETILGKASICWNCDKQFVIDNESFGMDKPLCYNCLHPAIEDDETRKMKEYLASFDK